MARTAGGTTTRFYFDGGSILAEKQGSTATAVYTTMNKDYITFNLAEALEELTITLASIKDDGSYREVDFRIAMEHVYHHINFAWNT